MFEGAIVRNRKISIIVVTSVELAPIGIWVDGLTDCILAFLQKSQIDITLVKYDFLDKCAIYVIELLISLLQHRDKLCFLGEAFIDGCKKGVTSYYLAC